MQRVGWFVAWFAIGAMTVIANSNAQAQTIWDRARHPELRDLDEDLARGRSLLDAARRLEYQEPLPASFVREPFVLQAHAIFTSAVQRAPDHVGALLGLAESLEALQALDDARQIAVLPAATTRFADPAPTTASASEPAAPRDRYAEALALLERADAHAGQGPELAELLFRLGVLNTRRMRFNEARDAYIRYLTLALPTHARSVGLCNLAETYVYLHDLERAVRTYNECVSVEPHNAGGWWGLANAADRDGRAGDARDAALHALSQDPYLADLIGPHVFYVPAFDRYYYLGLAHEIAQRPRDALAAWQRYLTDGGAGTPWADRAREHIAQLGVALRPPHERTRRRR